MTEATEAVALEAETSEAVTLEAVTSEALTARVTTEAVTTEAVTSASVTSEEVTLEAVTSEALTARVTTEAVTAEAVTLEEEETKSAKADTSSEALDYCECTCKFYQVTSEAYGVVCTCSKNTAANCQSFECKPEWNYYNFNVRMRDSKNLTKRTGSSIETRGKLLSSIEEFQSDTEDTTAGWSGSGEEPWTAEDESSIISSSTDRLLLSADTEEATQVERSDVSEGTSAAGPGSKTEAFYRAKRIFNKDVTVDQLSSEDFVFVHQNLSKQAFVGNTRLSLQSSESIELGVCPCDCKLSANLEQAVCDCYGAMTFCNSWSCRLVERQKSPPLRPNEGSFISFIFA